MPGGITSFDRVAFEGSCRPLSNEPTASAGDACVRNGCLSDGVPTRHMIGKIEAAGSDCNGFPPALPELGCPFSDPPLEETNF